MSGHLHNSPVQTVKYKNFKNCVDKDTEVLISSVVTTEKEKIHHLDFCLRQVGALLCTILVLLFVSSAAVYFYVTKGDSDVIVCNDHNASLIGTETDANLRTACVPLQPTNKVVITLTMASNYSCSDNATCSSLLQRIEQEEDGLKYNFVIASEYDLYIGLGFKCQVNNTDNALHIKVFRDYIPFPKDTNEYYRISEIIEQGILCGKILSNFSVSTACEGDIICNHRFEDYTNYDHLPIAGLSKSRYTFYEPNHELGILLHKDLKWVACGYGTKEATNTTKSKVITVESLSTSLCRPYQPVDKISVDIILSPPVTCSDNSSCSEMTHQLEEHHDGFNYNFIIGTHYDLYVGLGFKCRPTNSLDNTLKIKVLRLPENDDDFDANEIGRFAQLLEQGLACGKILQNFTISSNCPGKELEECYSLLEILEGDGANEITDFSNSFRHKSEHFDPQVIEPKGGGKVIKHHVKLIACHKKLHVLETSTQPSTSTTPHETTSSDSNEAASMIEENIHETTSNELYTTSDTSTERNSRIVYDYYDNTDTDYYT